ncbi:AVIToxin-VAR1, partial [Antrostomus carolinensis]
QACDRDQQCGGGMCCAVSLWIRSLRMCTPMGNLGEECHPLSHRVSTS